MKFHCGTCHKTSDAPQFPLGWSRSPAAADVYFCDECKASKNEELALTYQDREEVAFDDYFSDD